MIVNCPKCNIQLTVDDEKISPSGSNFKCPNCASVILLRKPMVVEQTVSADKILVAHGNEYILQKLIGILRTTPYEIEVVRDGKDALVKAEKYKPGLMIVDLALPGIYGFELCKQIKASDKLKEIKIIILTSSPDGLTEEQLKLYSADAGIVEAHIENLPSKIGEVLKIGAPSALRKPQASEKAAKSPIDEVIDKARRLARTIVSDIALYNPTKVSNAIASDTFYAVFEKEINEGKKLYESRIPPEIRSAGDFYEEAIDNFISGRKKLTP